MIFQQKILKTLLCMSLATAFTTSCAVLRRPQENTREYKQAQNLRAQNLPMLNVPGLIDDDARQTLYTDELIELNQKNQKPLTFIYFGRMMCNDRCPTDMKAMKGIWDEWEERGRMKKIQFVFINLDPNTNSDEMKSFDQFLPKDAIKLRGATPALNAAASSMKVEKESVGTQDERYGNTGWLYILYAAGDNLFLIGKMQLPSDSKTLSSALQVTLKKFELDNPFIAGAGTAPSPGYSPD